MTGLKMMILFMISAVDDAPIHAYQCGKKVKLIFLKTTYFQVWSVRLEFWLLPKHIMPGFRFISLICLQGILMFY
jgi:hypothetical protein